jgi:peptidyl-prolyl cis-trans isomerase A (cyclophilin A)
MKNIAVLMSLVVLVFAMSSCTKGCKKEELVTPPPTEEHLPTHGKDINQGQEQAPSEHQQADEAINEKEQLMKEFDLKPNDKLYAEFDINMGKIKAELFWEKAPMTVRNFVELAQGKKEWLYPGTHEKMVNKPLYDGTIFHRVIKGFMIQGGDPTGTGTGDPGYKFKDEFHPDLKHDKKGVLSMANSGPNTNGSQFFITEVATPHLDKHHSVFGQVHDEASLEVVSKIASVPTVAEKPQKDVVLKKVIISKGQ